MKINLKNKRALIGGSSKGLGYAVAKQLAACGAEVTLVSRNESLLKKNIIELKELTGCDHNYLLVDYNNSKGYKKMSNEILYNSQVISFLEELWGDGFLSPGGSDEVKKVIEGIQIKDKRVLDIGSGSGACAVLLAKDYSAKQVVGIDVEPPVCEAAQNSVLAAGLSEKISIELVSPGKLPFEDGSFDKKMFEYFDKLKYKLSKRSQIGRVDAILIEKNKIYTAADPRGDDYASGK